MLGIWKEMAVVYFEVQPHTKSGETNEDCENPQKSHAIFSTLLSLHPP
jgi:hypothetical protein